MLGAAIDRYREVLADRQMRRVFVVATIARIPLFAIGVAMSLHVVQTLGRSWTDAGFVITATTLGFALCAPYRGRLVDRVGLRRTLIPTVVGTAVLYALLPFASFWPLVALAGLMGFFQPPIFSMTRQAIVAMAPLEQRQGALSLDAVLGEVSYMAGPMIGAWAATALPTRVALPALAAVLAASTLAFVILDPPTHTPESADHPHVPIREWLTPWVALLIVVSAASATVLTATDLTTVAAMREWGQTSHVGWVLALWGLGSLLGGLAYGALPRAVPIVWLLALLGVVTILPGFATSVPMLALLLVVTGVMCAPSIIAQSSELASSVPSRAFGEAQGWSSSAGMAGAAFGAPLVGLVIDNSHPGMGFIAAGGLGLVVAAAGALILTTRRRRRADGAPQELAVAGDGSPS